MSRGLRLVKDILWVLVFFGIIAAAFRIWFGLGATTNLSDGVPWGLWKILNMIAGVALSTGGFAVGLLVYVLRLERFKPLLKPAILVAFLGYGCSCAALLFDIGLPHRFWHPLVMWNHHSFLFEVFWCVMLYFTVAAIELLPTLLEGLRRERMARWLHRIAFGVVVVGISLSSLHHSSLGSLFLVSPQRLHPLWYSTWLPGFFILSAVGAGLMVIVLLRILYARIYDPEPIFGAKPPDGAGIICSLGGDCRAPRPVPATGRHLPMLQDLATIAAFILGSYFLLKVSDLLLGGSWRAFLAGSWESWLYGAELVVGVLLPVAIIALPAMRKSPVALGLAAALASGGLVLNRLNVGIFGYLRSAEAFYFPSLAEWALGLGVIAAAGLAFLAISESCPIFDDQWEKRRVSKGLFSASFDSLSHVWITVLDDGLQRVTLIAVMVVPLAWMAMYPPFTNAGTGAAPVSPSTAVDAERRVLRIDGDREYLHTLFPHAEHQDRLRAGPGCVACHHVSLPGDHNTPCSRCHVDMLKPSSIFDHLAHMESVAEAQGVSGLHPENRSCEICHAPGQAESARSAKSCLECHQEDIWMSGVPGSGADLSRAPGFMEAMHGTCIPCHQREDGARHRSGLGECSTCHPSLAKAESACVGR